MATIRITDDLSATSAKVVRMECDCGWMDKSFSITALGNGVTHFRNKHGGDGTFLYKGDSRLVQNGTLLNGSLVDL